MSKILDDLRKERDQVRAAAIAIAESEDFNPEDKNFKDLETRAAEYDARIAKLVAVYAAQEDADALDGRMAKAAKARQDAEQQQQQPAQTRSSWGEAFTRSEVFTEYRGRGQSARYEIDGPETRALPTSLTDLVAAGMTFDRFRVDNTPPPMPTPLLDAISTVNVSGNAIEYVAWRVVAGGAVVVPEEGTKPSIEYGPTVVAGTLDMIAVYTQLTRQLMEDASAVSSYINNDLQRQVLLREEAEAAGVIGAATLTTVVNTDLLAGIRTAVADVQMAGYQPNAVLLNPGDWAALDVAVMNDTVNGPVIGQRFWGLTPIPSAGQAVGHAIVGDFKAAIDHFVRSNVSVYITDSHASTFTSNVFTLLAERRSKTAVVRPQALAKAQTAAG